MVMRSFSVLLPSRTILPANAYQSFLLPCGREPFAFFFLLSQKYPSRRLQRNQRNFRVFCSQGNGIDKGKSQNGNNVQEEPNDNQRPSFPFRWADLLNPDPQNILAVGLTGLLTWASVQVLWQILFISIAIVVAALKNTLYMHFIKQLNCCMSLNCPSSFSLFRVHLLPVEEWLYRILSAYIICLERGGLLHFILEGGILEGMCYLMMALDGARYLPFAALLRIA